MPEHRAELYARALFDWHSRFGTELAARRLTPESLASYQHVLDVLAKSDMSDPSVARDIARQQLSGSFEWSYGEMMPPCFLHDFPDEAMPLFEVARLIMREVEHVQEMSDRYGPLSARARVAYAEYDTPAQGGVGGVELLLSCSIELDSGENNVRLLTPEQLGFRVVPRDDEGGDLVNRLRAGQLHIEVSGETAQGEEEGAYVIPNPG